jgi:hypothetical protein
MPHHALDLMPHDRTELPRCVALLADAVAGAERLYGRLEADLAAFDRRTKAGVDRLRTNGVVQSSLVWEPASAA